MGKERKTQSVFRKVLPRLLKAAFWAFIMGGWALLFLRLPGPSEYAVFLPVSEQVFSGFLVVFVLFEVAIQLLSGTIFRYALSITRTLISMVYLLFVTNSGVVTLPIPSELLPSGVETIRFTVEFRAVLAVLLLFSLISVVKNLLQAIDFLSEGAEQPIVLPELP